MSEVTPEDIPKSVCMEMEIVRQTGGTNMVIKSNVRQIAESVGLDNLLSWLDEHTKRQGRAYATLLDTFPEKAKNVHVDFSKHPFTVQEFYTALGVSEELIERGDHRVCIMSQLNDNGDTSTESVNDSELESGVHHVNGSEITLSALSDALEVVVEQTVHTESERNVYLDIANDIESKPRHTLSNVYRSVEIEKAESESNDSSDSQKTPVLKQVIQNSVDTDENTTDEESVADAIEEMDDIDKMHGVSKKVPFRI